MAITDVISLKPASVSRAKLKNMKDEIKIPHTQRLVIRTDIIIYAIAVFLRECF